ncbi:hypothetical protein AAMO2058_000118600 [Amorphochlora amoebiformis]
MMRFQTSNQLSMAVLAVIFTHILLVGATHETNRQESLAGERAQATDNKCSKVRPGFCTMVDWSVPMENIEHAVRTKADLQVEMMAINFKGSKSCLRDYKELHCRYMYPICHQSKPRFPCRHECEEFKKRCTGTLLHSCKSFPTVDCGKPFALASPGQQNNEQSLPPPAATPSNTTHHRRGSEPARAWFDKFFG